MVLAEQAAGFKVGVILGITGSVAEPAEACRNGITLALEAAPKRDHSRLELLFEDDQNMPRHAVASFHKLVKISGVDAVVTYSSSTSKAVAPLAEKYQIPLLAIATDPGVVKGRKFVMNFWVAPEVQVRTLLPEVQRRGYRKIAIITAIQDATLVIRKIFKDLGGDSIQVVLDETYPADTKEFRPFLTKVRALPDLDAIFANLYYGQPGSFARQARELGIALPLFNIESFEDSNQVKISQGALIGGLYAQADDPGEEFLATYRKRFPNATTYTAGNCHDLVGLFLNALARGIAANDLNRYFHEVQDYKGAMGVFSATSDNLFSLPATLKVVTEEGFKKLSE